MKPILTYRNREITQDEVAFIRNLIEKHPEECRTALSKRICRAWDWVQYNGELKDMVCRGLLLRLERQGRIVLPPRKRVPPNFSRRKQPKRVTVDESPICASLKQLAPITLKQVRRSSLETLFNGLIAQYHYLRYTQPVGEHLKYLAFADGRPVGCLAFSSAAYQLGCRDRFIGWRPEVRKENLHLLAYNTRFLVLPWIKIPHLASHLLAKCAKILPEDWHRLYHHPIYWLETFVDTAHFKGTCYRAANWILLGKTAGRGKDNNSHMAVRSIKYIYGYPLVKDFRAKLGLKR
jgi:hypothetical protein